MLRAVAHSIRHKLVAVVFGTTLAALVVAGAAMMIYELRAFQQSAVTDLLTQADIIGRASAPALTFNDPKTAHENLGLLRARPMVSSAAIYTASGELFATYAQSGLQEVRYPETPGADGYRIEGKSLILFKRIMERNEPQGTVYLQARYPLADKIIDYLGILGTVITLSLLVAVLMSAWLQRAVTRPILDVTNVAHKVVESRDFSLRVDKTTTDEIGYLVDAFNAMLAEIGRRAAALEASNRTLKYEMSERQAAEDALRAADRLKDEFLATLAHELRNPLAPLRNALQILAIAGDKPPIAAQAREMMERQLRQLVRLVDDLLDVSRITTGRLVLRPERTELGGVVQSALDTVGPMIESRGHKLILDLPDRPIYLQGDPTRLAQVFSNLLNNAVKYTEPGGDISLAMSATGAEAVVRVKDNGIGIPPDMLPAIFEMFMQVDRSLERLHAGLGVGLTLARRLVELHGGTLEARSGGLGRGSEFIVRLPLSLSLEPAPVMPQERQAQVSGVQRRVLVADDNQDHAESLAMILRSMGNEVVVAHDGLEAAAAAASFRPEFAFLDIGMPGLNGYELARRLRQSTATVGAVLVAVTGWGQDKDKQLAHEAGFNHHLVKPVDFAQIQRILVAAVPG